MFNRILWTLDNEMDGSRFERLCTDLLSREGYRDILPIGGTHDRGRDAEIRPLKGIRDTGGVIFFQYSLEERWEGKLKRELENICKHNHKINNYVFVTSRKVTGRKRDQLASIVANKYQWGLIIYDREWLRHQLEERHPDLAARYLAVTESIAMDRHNRSELIPPASDESDKRAWTLYRHGEYEAAAVKFKMLLKMNDKDIRAWQALAWCQYSLFHYNEALASVNCAISLDNNDKSTLLLKACILTEGGIQNGLKVNLLLAKDIFETIMIHSKHWVYHYNYGNVLHALGEYEAAKQEFLLAIECDPQQASVWKNLGAIYFYLHDHKKEINCYDKALAINSELPEALASKGVTLLRIFGKAQEAADLILKAIEIDNSIAIRWPLAWYWLSQAYYKMGNLSEALRQVDAGLEIVPHHAGLLNLKALILPKLWPEDSQYIDQAIRFYKIYNELFNEDYNSLLELIKIYNTIGQSQKALDLLEEYIDLGEIEFLPLLKMTGFNFNDCLIALKYLPVYRAFRKSNPISDYISLIENQELQSDYEFYKILFIIFSLPFGYACHIYANTPQDERSNKLSHVLSLIQNSLQLSFPKQSTRLSRIVKLGTAEEIADGLSRILVFWPEIALLEFSRQFGYVGGYFGVPANQLDASVAGIGENLNQWQAIIRNDTLSEINKCLRIFKEE
jgi:tetratricopeptide (TPR) repeat protein